MSGQDWGGHAPMTNTKQLRTLYSACRASLSGSSSGWWNQSKIAQPVFRKRFHVAVADAVYPARTSTSAKRAMENPCSSAAFRARKVGPRRRHQWACPRRTLSQSTQSGSGSWLCTPVANKYTSANNSEKKSFNARATIRTATFMNEAQQFTAGVLVEHFVANANALDILGECTFVWWWPQRHSLVPHVILRGLLRALTIIETVVALARQLSQRHCSHWLQDLVAPKRAQKPSKLFLSTKVNSGFSWWSTAAQKFKSRLRPLLLHHPSLTVRLPSARSTNNHKQTLSRLLQNNPPLYDIHCQWLPAPSSTLPPSSFLRRMPLKSAPIPPKTEEMTNEL